MNGALESSSESGPRICTPRVVGGSGTPQRILDSGDGHVGRVAAHLGVTTRHLRRVFADNVGLSPKEYARAARLQRAVRMAVNRNDWSGIAADAGYYDQAHFIADFRELMGVTPGMFVKHGHEVSLICN